MLFMKLATDRKMAETKDTRDRQHETTRAVEVTKGAARSPSSGRPWTARPAAQTPPLLPPLVTDSEWFNLSAEDQ